MEAKYREEDDAGAGFVGYLDSVRDAQRARNSPRLSVPAESQELDREAMLRKQREASRAAIERRRAAGAVRSNTSYHDSKDASDGNAPRFGSAPEPSAGGKSSVAPPKRGAPPRRAPPPGGRPGGSAAAAFRASRRPPPRDGAAGRAGARGGAAARWRAKAAKDDDGGRDPTPTPGTATEAKSEAKAGDSSVGPSDGGSGAGVLASPSPALAARFGRGNSGRFGAPTEPIDPLGESATEMNAQAKADAKATGGELKGGGTGGRFGAPGSGSGLAHQAERKHDATGMIDGSLRTTQNGRDRDDSFDHEDAWGGRASTQSSAVARQSGDRSRQPQHGPDANSDLGVDEPELATVATLGEAARPGSSSPSTVLGGTGNSSLSMTGVQGAGALAPGASRSPSLSPPTGISAGTGRRSTSPNASAADYGPRPGQEPSRGRLNRAAPRSSAQRNARAGAASTSRGQYDVDDRDGGRHLDRGWGREDDRERDHDRDRDRGRDRVHDRGRDRDDGRGHGGGEHGRAYDHEYEHEYTSSSSSRVRRDYDDRNQVAHDRGYEREYDDGYGRAAHDEYRDSDRAFEGQRAYEQEYDDGYGRGRGGGDSQPMDDFERDFERDRREFFADGAAHDRGARQQPRGDRPHRIESSRMSHSPAPDDISDIDLDQASDHGDHVGASRDTDTRDRQRGRGRYAGRYGNDARDIELDGDDSDIEVLEDRRETRFDHDCDHVHEDAGGSDDGRMAWGGNTSSSRGRGRGGRGRGRGRGRARGRGEGRGRGRVRGHEGVTRGGVQGAVDHGGAFASAARSGDGGPGNGGSSDSPVAIGPGGGQALQGLAKPKKKTRQPVVIFDGARVPFVREDLRDFVMSPLPGGAGPVMRCTITRSKGLRTKDYIMDVQQQGQQPRQILYARKLPSKTSHYVVSLEQSDLGKKRHERSEFFVGKLRRSEGTKEYVLYGPGANPNDLQGEGKDDEMDTGARSSQVRDEHCCIVYNLKRRENQGVEQRKMEVVIPSVLQNGERTDKWRSSTNIGDSIFDVFNHVRFKGGQNMLEKDRITSFNLRVSRYDALSSCLIDFKVLLSIFDPCSASKYWHLTQTHDFACLFQWTLLNRAQSRATQKSVKNFQIIESLPEDVELRQRYWQDGGQVQIEDQEAGPMPPIILQMGKISSNQFNCDFQFPLSPLQAFAVCLSRFDVNPAEDK